jgi:asparagine synthase (glutamine-hydrolysing)
MCGIAGFLGGYGAELLPEIDRLIAHRGPDGAGTWNDVSQGVGLVHRRLAIIDPHARSDQPMWDATGRAVIVFNGEIYNYRSLRAELESLGRAFRTGSDTEVILNAVLEFGPSGLGRLNGIFSFALWDSRKHELLVARDVHGVKPLYCATSPSGFVFASELKALLAFPDIDRRLDLRALQGYMSFLFSPGSRTPFRGVTKLEPGSYLQARRGEAPRSGSFRVEPYRQRISEMSEDEAVAQARFYLRQSVERQMVADVPVGAFLSGGLDSSSVVNFARQHNGVAPLECFTIGFEGAEGEGFSEDLPYARAVARHLGVPLSTVWVAPDMSSRFESMIWHLDEPQADPAALNVFFISKLAREHGVKVLLSGAGGDDIFSGYRRHQALMAERYWSWLPVEMRRMLRWISDRPSKNGPIGRRLSKALQYAPDSADRRLAGYFVWLRSELLRGLLTADVQREVLQDDPMEPLLAACRSLPVGTSPLNQMLSLDTRFFLTDHNLNYTDKMSMAAGIEVRVPFLDPDLVDFAARLPLHYKQRGATGKWLLKEAMEPFLPAAVIQRPKAGFGVPLRAWMRGDLRVKVDELLSRESLGRRGLFDPGSVQSLLKQDREGRVDAAYPLFEIICIETWCRLFVDRQSVSPL